MIDLKKISKSDESIFVSPSDNIFTELGNNTYDFTDLISELIDNSIAAKRSDQLLRVEIEIYVDKAKNEPTRIIVRDNASGISKDKMALAVTPAGIQSPDSLNEHGLGMKQAIAAMGTLEYLATKTTDEKKARVILKFAFGKLDYFLADFPLESGTEICVCKVKPIVNTNPQSITMLLSPYLGARYRRFLKPDNKLVKIEIFLKDKDNDNVLYSWDIEEVKPLYFHPSERRNKPVLLNKRFSGKGWKAALTFGYAPTNEECKELGLEPLFQYDPYYVSMAKQGLDILLHDRVVRFHQLPELGLVTARHSDFNSIRGEIMLIEGFKTAITKNSIIQDEKFMECISELKSFLTGAGEEDQKNYLRLKKYPEWIPEALLRDRLANWLKNNPVNKKDNVKTEFVVEGLEGKIDILADGEAYELKRDQANGLNVYQLFAYMDIGKVKKGYLIASSFTTGAKVASEFIKANHGKEIIIAELKDFPINHPLSEEERNNYY